MEHDMSTKASIGNGTKFQINVSTTETPDWKDIAEVYDLTPPNETTDVVDASSFDSRERQFIYGLTDPGEMSFEMNFVPGSASEGLLLAAKASLVSTPFRMIFPNAAAWSFNGLVTGYEPAVPNDDKMTATVTIKVTGAVDREAA
jgi:hypothetical protein